MRNSITFDRFFNQCSNDNSQLVIEPLEQREYEWAKKQVQMILCAIDEQIEYKWPEGKYLHTIAIFNDNSEDKMKVTDGNQRMTTIYTAFFAVRNFIKNNNLEEYKPIVDYVETQLFNQCKSSVFYGQPILRVQAPDRGVFSDIINNNQALYNDKHYQNRDKKIYYAYKLIYNHITEKCMTDMTYVSSFFYDGLKHLYTIVEMCENERESADYFNTQDAGLKLSDNIRCIAYINSEIKQYCKSNCDDGKYNEYSHKIMEINKHLKTDQQHFFTYFYYYLTDKTTKKNNSWEELEKYIKDVFKGKLSNRRFSNILELIDLLAYFTNVRKSMMSKNFNDYYFDMIYKICDKKALLIDYAVIDMKTDKLDYNFTLKEEKNILKYLMTCKVRSSFDDGTFRSHPEMWIGGLISKCVNKAIEENRIGSVDSIFLDELKSDDGILALRMGYCTDEAFKLSVKQCPLRDPKDRAYMFTELNDFIGQMNGSDKQNLFGGVTEMTIEHIIPQCNNKGNKLINTIGNLTLISRSDNSSMGDKPFKEKLPTFRKSTIHLNQELMEKEDFTFEDVKERNERYSEIMVQAFRLP